MLPKEISADPLALEAYCQTYNQLVNYDAPNPEKNAIEFVLDLLRKNSSEEKQKSHEYVLV